MSNTIEALKFEIICHGEDGSQYFPGCGVAFTDFDYVVTGCASNKGEAFADAIEQIACCSGHDNASLIAKTIESSEEAQEYIADEAFEDSATMEEANASEDSDWYFYVSIRWS